MKGGRPIRPGVAAPGFAGRLREIVESSGGVEFQRLESESLVNRLRGDRFPFGWTMNPFRGCELGCRYCYARPTHQYLGHADPRAFEQRVYVKTTDWARVVAELRRARDSGQEVALGTATDPYQPAERRFAVTRRVLEAMLGVPGLRVGITTKSTLVARDLALLQALARGGDLWVNVSLCSLDADLLRIIEPRAPRPDRRLKAMAALAAAGIRTRLFAMPVLPLFTDREESLRGLLAAARRAGAREAIAAPLFLRGDTHAFFLDFVARQFPWALRRYRELYPAPGSARRDYAAEIERLVERLAGEAGLAARTREERIRDEAPARPRQLSLVW
jgi:DNA repair photolyase